MKTDIRVAVCTNRAPDAVAEALEALRREGSPTLVLSGPAAGRPADYDAGEVLVEPRPGLSYARNRALAWAAEHGADVIAFVDDDAVVDPGWHEALQRRWDEAPPDVGWIGGPIRLRHDAEPPPWFSDGIRHVLTVLERGPEVRELDPEQEVVYGANISFRVDALERIGGFDPALGHAGRRVFFGEEDHAQRALGRLGYRGRYVPDAGVDHVVALERLTRGTFLRRRFAFGAVLGMRRGRARTLASAQALRSTAGALSAQLRGREALAMERAVRAAENLGVLYGSTKPRLIA